MGFVYFLLFEFVYFQRIYSGSVGRDMLGPRMGIINYFVDIAELEWDDFEPGMTQARREEFVVAFYE